MKLRFKDLGEQRWLCYATAYSTKEANEFKRWISEHLEDRYMLDLTNVTENDENGLEYHYTLRGGDVRDRTMVALCWG